MIGMVQKKTLVEDFLFATAPAMVPFQKLLQIESPKLELSKLEKLQGGKIKPIGNKFA